jgi:hypothetical protein
MDDHVPNSIIGPSASASDASVVSSTLRCPKCGRQVQSLRCGHCGSRLPDWQADLYGAAIRRIAKLGGSRADAGHQGGSSPEPALGDSQGDDEQPRDSGGASTERSEPTNTFSIRKTNGDPCDCSTPQWLFDRCNELVQLYCGKPFTRDVCAAGWNHKCKDYWTKEDDALGRDWEGVCWCNPPWSGEDLEKFVRKAVEAVGRGTTSVCLIPIVPKLDLQFLADNGRVHQVVGPVAFARSDGREFISNAGWATTGLLIVVFGPGIRPGWGSPIKKSEKPHVEAGPPSVEDSAWDHHGPHACHSGVVPSECGTSKPEGKLDLSISDRADLLRAGKQSPAHGIVYTPPHVAQFLFDLLVSIHPRIVVDVASGNGDLSHPWRAVAKIIEYELGFGRDFFRCPDAIAADLVLCNPPFGQEKEFLRRILRGVPETTPIALICTHRVRLGSYPSSKDWTWCRDEWPPITSIVSLPRGVFRGVNETTEILLFRAPGLAPHYFLRSDMAHPRYQES